MVIRITKNNIEDIKNKQIKEEARRYVDIYKSFTDDICSSGVELSEIDRNEERLTLIKEIEKLGAKVRNNGKSVVLGELSPSCDDCKTGIGSSTYIISLKCNRDCYFCTNKNQANYAEQQKSINDIASQFKDDLKRYKKMKSVSITGGEPLLFVDECVNFLKLVKKNSKQTQTRIYTNGDLATPETLEKLKKAGLDEIRFGLKLNDNGKIEDKALENIAIATKYISRVMVEMPVIPNTLEEMKELLLKLDKLNIFGINILEFLYPWVHADEYKAKGYKVKNRPYEILFNYNYAGGVSVCGSDIECLKLLKFAAEQKLKLGVHYCSLENKLTAQVFHHNVNVKLNATEFFSPNDYFIKSVRAHGNDISVVKQKLDDGGCTDYIYNTSDKFIEFSPVHIILLKGLDIELALSYLALDYDENGATVLREVQIDCVKPEATNEKL